MKMRYSLATLTTIFSLLFGLAGLGSTQENHQEMVLIPFGEFTMGGHGHSDDGAPSGFKSVFY
jgi:formylglycine-generating enzyme required for sulfatase activity